MKIKEKNQRASIKHCLINIVVSILLVDQSKDLAIWFRDNILSLVCYLTEFSCLFLHNVILYNKYFNILCNWNNL